VFCYLDYRHVALQKIGQLNRHFRDFVKQGSPLFDLLPRKTRQNHVEDEAEFSQFVSEKIRRNLNDFNIELFLRAKLLPKFLSECP
jgi:hypothetical protein